MSKLSAFYQERKENDLKWFFGEDLHKISGKYFTFHRVVDNDNIVIVTNNIEYFRKNTSYVMIIGKFHAIYLKDWQVRPVHNHDLGMNAFAVKLNRNYFKPYTFKSEFQKFSFDTDEPQTFDDLLEIAKEQDATNLPFATAHMG